MNPHDIPVGTVLTYAGPVAEVGPVAEHRNPAQVEANLASVGWLFCDGRSLDRQDYAHLFGVIGSAFGGSDGDGTFNLPDLRGRFLRGVDLQTGATRDPDAAKRTASGAGGSTGNVVGSLEVDAFQGHEHQYTAVVEGPTAQAGPGPATLIVNPAPQPTKSDLPDSAGDGAPRVSSETRPVNLSFNFIIRYR